MFRFVVLISFALLVSSCRESRAGFDTFLFSKFGKTLFSSAETVSVKELHLNHEAFDEKEVVVEGSVAQVGEYNTYVVLVDSNATVLVLQTLIPLFEDKIKETDVGKKFRILGKLVLGKKGLPTVEARSVIEL